MPQHIMKIMAPNFLHMVGQIWGSLCFTKCQKISACSDTNTEKMFHRSFGSLWKDNDFADIMMSSWPVRMYNQFAAQNVILATARRSQFQEGTNMCNVLHNLCNVHPLIYRRGLKVEDLSRSQKDLLMQILLATLYHFVISQDSLCLARHRVYGQINLSSSQGPVSKYFRGQYAFSYFNHTRLS